jgi:hypothetical protein
MFAILMPRNLYLPDEGTGGSMLGQLLLHVSILFDVAPCWNFVGNIRHSAATVYKKL